MKRKIVIAVKLMSEEQAEKIRIGAAKKGFETVFFRSEEEAKNEVQDAEIMISGFPSLAKEAKALRWLCTPFAGVDEYTVPGAFASENVILTNASGAYGVTLSEHVLMLTLEVLRRQKEYMEYIGRKQWVRKLPIRSVYGSRIVILGTGDIGQEIALRLKGFRPEKITGVNKKGVLVPKPEENKEQLEKDILSAFDEIRIVDQLEEVLKEAQILIMALPGVASTRHIMDEKKLSLLPDGAVIVNIGRGSSMDEAALEKELRSGRLFAALDVFETEPLPDTSPLWDCPNLLITAHVAGDHTLPHTLDRIVDMFLEDLERYCEGRPLLRQVDLKKGY